MKKVKKVYKKFTIEDVHEFCEGIGLICKSDKYKTIKEPLIFECTDCGEDFNRNFDNVRNRKKTICNKCGKGNGQRKQAFGIDYVREFVKNESNCILESSTYTNTDTKLDFICACGERFKATFYKFKNVNKRQCTPCGDKIIVSKLLTPIKDIEKMVADANYTFVSRFHSSEDKKHNIKVICDKNHTYEVSYHSFKSGQRCPHCNSSFGELKIEEFLRNRDINYKIEYKFRGLLGLGGSNLRFDFAVMDSKGELSCLIEFDGKQHFEPVEIMGGIDKLKITQKHDEIKNNYCKDNDIRLIRIPYWDFNKVDSILEEVLNERSFDMSG